MSWFQIRDLKGLDMESFKKDIANSEICLNPETDLERLLEKYNTCLSDLFDTHVPIQTKVVRNKRTSWYTDNFHEMRQHRKRIPKKYRKDKSSEELQDVIQVRH